jgi:hypothetical protein
MTLNPINTLLCTVSIIQGRHTAAQGALRLRGVPIHLRSLKHKQDLKTGRPVMKLPTKQMKENPLHERA